MLHVQHAYFSSFNQSNSSFEALSLPLTSSMLKLSGGEIRDTKTLNLSRNIVSLRVFVFHLGRSTWPATKTFVVSWRKVLRRVERWSSLSNKFRLCYSFFIELTTCHATNAAILDPHQANQRTRRTAVLQPATNFTVVRQVDHARWKTRNINPKLARNNVAGQVEGFVSRISPP